MKRRLVPPTADEDAAIASGIAADPDTYELDESEFRQLRPAPTRGRPPGSGTKVQLTIRLSKQSIDRFRATGEGWQTRIDAALADWLRTHSPEDLRS